MLSLIKDFDEKAKKSYRKTRPGARIKERR
jgi:hypothetical protein